MEVTTEPLDKKDRFDLALALATAAPAWFGPARAKRGVAAAALYAVFFAVLALANTWLSPPNSPWVPVVNGIALAAGGLVLVLVAVRAGQALAARRRAAKMPPGRGGTARVNGKGVALLPGKDSEVGDNEGTESLKWSEVEKLLVTRRLYVFVAKSGQALALRKADMGEKTATLEGYVNSHMQGKGKQVLRDE